MTLRPHLERSIYWFGILGMLAALLGAYGSGWGWWPFTTGFLFVGIGAVCALATVVLAIVAWRLNRDNGGSGGFVRFALLLALILLALIGYWFVRGASYPQIHDVTTNSADPPAFKALTLREDNLIGVYNIDNWRKVHDGAYSDIRPVVLAVTPDQAIAKAKTLIEARGWEVAADEDGRIEATDTITPFRFKDDVVIVATPENGGAATRVDMRSVSRVGVSDLGVNAERLRAFLRDLQSAE